MWSKFVFVWVLFFLCYFFLLKGISVVKVKVYKKINNWKRNERGVEWNWLLLLVNKVICVVIKNFEKNLGLGFGMGFEIVLYLF